MVFLFQATNKSRIISKDYYIGSCQDIDEGIKKHNTNHTGFTGKTGDWQLKWLETQPGKAAALKREKQIKNWKSRVMLEKLINA